MGHFLFVHSQIPKLQRRAWFRRGHRTEDGVQGGRGRTWLQGTHLPAIHVQQDHMPHIVSCDHHSAFDRHIQAAKPDAGGRDRAVRFLGTESNSIYSLLKLMSDI